MELIFKALTLEYQDAVESILSKIHNQSCQFSFASLFSYKDKYGTEICIDRHNTIFIRQLKRTHNQRIAYFLPLNAKCLNSSIIQILETAKIQNHEVFFFGILETDKEKLLKINCNNFLIQENRDWSEYLYSSNNIANLTDKNLSKIRRGVNQFWQLYGEKIIIETITPQNIPDIIQYQKQWYNKNLTKKQKPDSLTAENQAIHNGLTNFTRLKLTGIVAKFDNIIIGYSYGLIISENVFDIMVQKANYEYRHIYKMLFHEIAQRYQKEAILINMEEDIGILGLRQLKTEYKPNNLLTKYIAIPQKAL